jgi:uncharacterized protein (TIGR03435 family)
MDVSVRNSTGLEGFYAFTLNFSARTLKASPTLLQSTMRPRSFTALQEQLGLKLQPEETMVPVLVIDHIERPSEN